MHHLEPLAWAASKPKAARIVRGHNDFVFADPLASCNPAQANLRFVRVALSIRSIFRLIAVFLRGVELPALPTSQAETAYAVLELAHIEFALVAWQPWCNPTFRSECARCVDELEDVVGALSDGKALPAFELIHAFDTLIALLVQIDGANRASKL